MGQLLPTAKPYSVVILKQGPKFGDDATPDIVWQHGRRNFGLRDDGVLAVVLPVTDGSDVCGIAVFAATVDETTAIMGDDPGVAAGVFTFEVHSCRGFPGTRCPSPIARLSPRSGRHPHLSPLLRRIIAEPGSNQLGHPQVCERQLELADVVLIGPEVAKPSRA